MKFVATKTAEQLNLQALHRVRERLVSQRTDIINQIRAFLLERGIVARQGLRFLRAELPRILAALPDVFSFRMVGLIGSLAEDWRRLEARIDHLSGEIIHEPAFSEMFVSHVLARTIRIEEDLVDQLFNSSEKRLARAVLSENHIRA